MKVISTLLKRVLFLGVCIVSWTIFPVLFIVGALALFLYALAAESSHSVINGKPSRSDERVARKVADGMRSAPQRPTSP